MRSVLVTRPQPGAARTAARLATLGYRALVLPLTHIVALPIGVGKLPARVDAVVATSANALDHLPPELAAALTGISLYAVGTKTAQAARQNGFTTVEDGPGSAGELAQLVCSRLKAGAEILYLCGKVRLGDFEQRLQRAGIVVRAVETYDTQPIECDDGRLSAVLGTEQVGAVLLYSAEAARHFVALAKGKIMGKAIEKADFLCISSRVAEMLDGFAPRRIGIAENPSEDALLNLLEWHRRHDAGVFSA